MLIGLIALFNYLINPYGVFTPRIDVSEKVFLKSQERLWKVRAITRTKPNALLLGSSRTRDGFDLKEKYFADGNNWFNSAVNGGNIYEMWHYYEHALSTNKINKMLIGVDFFMFNAYHKGRDFLPRYFFKKYDSRWNSIPCKKSITQLVSTLISHRALTDSLNTVFGVAFSELKQLQDESSGFMIREHTKVHEDYSFLGMEEAFLKEFWFPEPEKQFSFRRNDGYSPFDYYHKILESAYQNEIQTVIFISPSHARLWENLYQVGLGDKWKEWKRELVKINNDLAKKSQKRRFHVIDFSGFHQYSVEELPQKEEVHLRYMTYYTDSSHYRFTLGHEMLKVLSSLQHDDKLSSDWWNSINEKNIDEHLMNIDENQKSFKRSNLDTIKEINQQVVATQAFRRI